MESTGFAIDWKKVVTSMTNPKIGVTQKFTRSRACGKCRGESALADFSLHRRNGQSAGSNCKESETKTGKT